MIENMKNKVENEIIQVMKNVYLLWDKDYRYNFEFKFTKKIFWYLIFIEVMMCLKDIYIYILFIEIKSKIRILR